MTDVLTPTIRLTEPTPGGDSGTWATLLNSDLAYIDEAINQSITVSIADTNVTLVHDGTASDQARYLRYNFTGALTADRTVTLPANVKVGWASNNTTGGHNVILSAGGTTISLPNGSWTFFNCDGSNVITQSVRFGSANVSGSLTAGGDNADPIGNLTAGWVFGTNGSAIGYNNNGGTLSVGTGAGGSQLVGFFFGNSGVGSISTAGATTSYNTTSDARLKIDEGLIAADESGRIIDRLQPRWFRWKSNNDREPGFFAQQMHRAFPWAVRKGQGRPDSKNFRPWQTDVAKLMPVVVAELQSLRLRIADLEGR